MCHSRKSMVFVLIAVFALVVAACGKTEERTSPSTTATTTTTTTTVIPTTTTTTTITLPIGLGVNVVGEEFYPDGVPVYLSDYDPKNKLIDKDYLVGVGFNLPPGTEIKAPFDGYIKVLTQPGVSVKNMWMNIAIETNVMKAKWGNILMFIETTSLNVRMPQGEPTDWVQVRKGEIIAVTTDTREEIPLRVKGLTVLVSFNSDSLEAGSYVSDLGILQEFFPYIKVEPKARP